MVALAVWAGRAGWGRHSGGASPSGERTDEGASLCAEKDGIVGAEGAAEPGDAGGEDAAGPQGKAMRGKAGTGRPRSAEWGSEIEVGEESGEESERHEAAGRGERAVTFDADGLGRSFGSGAARGAVGGMAGNSGGEEESQGKAESSVVTPEEAERIFAANDAAAAAARELRQEALKEEKAHAEEESKPPVWIVRSLDWDEESQEMEVSFRFGVADGLASGDGEEGGALENGILVQRIPPGWEVQSSSPAADAFTAGSRKLKWLFSGGPLAGREVILLATPTEGADTGDWNVAPTWFTCRWNGKACHVQPELGAE